MKELAYSVVRFTPNPEEMEPINVALLLWNGKHAVVYDSAFPKLACIAPDFDRSLLRQYLDLFQHELMDLPPEAAAHAISSASSQFSVSAIRGADANRPNDVVPLLMERYLKRADVRPSRESVGQYVETRLQEFLSRFGVPPDATLRRASPSSFLSREVNDRLGGNGFKVARVVSGKRHLVLIDGLTLGISHAQIQSRASKVAFAYYRINQVREAIGRIEGRDLIRAAVTFAPEGHDLDPHEEFAIETVNRDSDALISSSSPDSKFGELLREAATDLI